MPGAFTCTARQFPPEVLMPVTCTGRQVPWNLELQIEGCETEHHKCSNAELLKLAEGDNLLQAVFDSIGIKACELPHSPT